MFNYHTSASLNFLFFFPFTSGSFPRRPVPGALRVRPGLSELCKRADGSLLALGDGIHCVSECVWCVCVSVCVCVCVCSGDSMHTNVCVCSVCSSLSHTHECVTVCVCVSVLRISECLS